VIHRISKNHNAALTGPNSPPSRGYVVVRVVLGLLLLTAAGLKGYDLWSNPVAADTRYLSKNWQIALVEAETLLGLWLLSGLWQFGSWMAAIVGFALLASVSLDLAVHKRPCGCLGSVGTRLELSAWHTLAVDLMAVSALLWWRPATQTERGAAAHLSSWWRVAYLALLSLVFIASNAAAFLTVGTEAGDPKNVVAEVPPSFADPGTRLLHTFIVRNRTPQIQRILSVTHSCMCSKAMLDRTELAPGDEAQLRLEADLTGRRGAEVFHAFLQLETGERWTYSVKTQVIQRVGFEPQNLHFGFLDPGEKKTQPVDMVLRAGPGDPMPQILSVVPESDKLTVSWTENPPAQGLDAARTARRLAVTVTADVAPGTSSSTVAVRYQLGGREHEAMLPITWIVRTYYEISPPRVFIMKPSEANGELKRTVVIKRVDDRPFKIRAVRTTEPFLRCAANLNATANTQELAIVIDSQGDFGTIAGEVIIETDESLQAKLEIPVTVMNRPLTPGR
jgi:hypothetical protein